jgi:hypothetical protein
VNREILHFPGKNENEEGGEGFSKFRETEARDGQAAPPLPRSSCSLAAVLILSMRYTYNNLIANPGKI